MISSGGNPPGVDSASAGVGPEQTFTSAAATLRACLVAALAKHLGEGAILDMSPCDLVPFLRGSTLWLIG